MQSLIHGNFEGAAQKQVYALVGAAAAIAAAVGPLLGGFITTFLSWRVGFALEAVDHRRGPLRDRARQGRAVHRRPRHGRGGAVLSVVGMGGIVLGILVWQEGGEAVARSSASASSRWSAWLVAGEAQARAQATLLDPDLFRLQAFRFGVTQQMLQQIALGGTMIALPIFLQMVLEYNASGRPLDRPAVAQHVRGGAARRSPGGRRRREHHPGGFVLAGRGFRLIVPIVRARDLGLVADRAALIAGAGLGLLVSQLNNYTLAPISKERVSEAAGVNSAAGSFGLSFGLAFAGAHDARRARLHLHREVEPARSCPRPTRSRSRRRSRRMPQLMSDNQLDDSSPGSPQACRTRSSPSTTRRGRSPFRSRCSSRCSPASRHRNAFRMRRLPDPAPTGNAESVIGV